MWNSGKLETGKRHRWKVRLSTDHGRSGDRPAPPELSPKVGAVILNRPLPTSRQGRLGTTALQAFGVPDNVAGASVVGRPGAPADA